MGGKEIRLGKLLSNGAPVIVAADHGSYMGPFPGIEDLRHDIDAFGKADAFLVMPGMAKQCQAFFARKGAPLCIVRVNWAAHYCKPHMKAFSRAPKPSYYDKGYNERLCEVRYAASLGADIVIASLLLGTDEVANTRNVTQFGEIVAEADSLGIPLIGEYIPMDGIDRYQGDVGDLVLGTRACAEFGADLIKTVFVEDFEKVAKTSGIPTLALGGGTFEKPSQAFEQARKALGKGAAGVVYGRNVLCAKNPAAFLDSLLEVVKHGMDPAEAEKKYLAKA
jgi:DhnA family fructose-bisphosphate aldolase class Ia